METAPQNKSAENLPPTEQDLATLRSQVREAVEQTRIFDIHTHLYDRAFGPLLLWGIDELLIYHYLVAETFRYIDMPYEKFWQLPKSSQADLVWKELFLEHSPVSESCRGVVTTLQALGLEPRKNDLPALRQWFSKWKVEDYITRCLEVAGVSRVCMTNSPFDDLERSVWEQGFTRDERFVSALRIDPVLCAWGDTVPILTKWGYSVGPSINDRTASEVRRFLETWTGKIRARYVMVSLTPDFEFPADSYCARLLEKAVLPFCREHNLPLAMMLGVKRGVNARLQLAGDGVGQARLVALENLCAFFPDNKFLATVLARENQHELAVLARKFRNLHIFGCWWFTNVPSLIGEISRMRLELVGLSMTPQHSDARVLDQLIYKWRHSRSVLANVLVEKYEELARAGWLATKEDIQRDVKFLFGGAFERFCGV